MLESNVISASHDVVLFDDGTLYKYNSVYWVLSRLENVTDVLNPDSYYLGIGS